ncbi:SCO3374 family protein [Streptomyces gamaensis]|uniref:SCO3374 family protein n=1 Tax=Streptomyces gamaensis TaxID=1763542 RepID=A0ABW0Z4J7_9ACTN
MTAAPAFPRPVPPPAAPSWCQVRRWYEGVLGWPTLAAADGEPVRLRTGVRFDALLLPADAGLAVLRRAPGSGPVALDGRARRVVFLVAAGSAEELPGLLDWLEWGGIALDLTALGAGGRITAPLPGGPPATPGVAAAPAGAGHGQDGAPVPGEAVWLRPPEPGREVEPTLPVYGLGGGGGAPDLGRLVGTAATEVHRARLRRARTARSPRPTGGQPLAFSYASRISAGTRPRSLTL